VQKDARRVKPKPSVGLHSSKVEEGIAVADVRALSAEFAEHPTVIDSRQIAATHFITSDGIGCLRIREHPLYNTKLDLDRFSKELHQILAGSP